MKSPETTGNPVRNQSGDAATKINVVDLTATTYAYEFLTR